MIMLFVGVMPASAAWKDFEVNLQAQGLLTDDEFANKTNTSLV